MSFSEDCWSGEKEDDDAAAAASVWRFRARVERLMKCGSDAGFGWELG